MAITDEEFEDRMILSVLTFPFVVSCVILKLSEIYPHFFQAWVSPTFWVILVVSFGNLIYWTDFPRIKGITT